MKIQFMGTAAATAMPLPFCNCDVCRQARRNGGKDFRKRSAALINDEMLIDLSPDLCSMAAMYGVDSGGIKYLLQTHSHSDHFDAGHFVTRSGDYATRGLCHMDIVCSRETCDDMNHWVRENEPGMDLYDARWQQDMDFSLHLIKPSERIQLGEYRITALDSGHDSRIQALVYIIEHKCKSMLYGTDLRQFPAEAWRELRNHRLDAVILDQTYGEGFNAGGHLDAGQVAKLVGRMRRLDIINDGSLVYATHISHEGNHIHDEMECLAGANGYHIAYDGLTLQI